MKIAFVYHWNEDKNSGVQRKVRSQVEKWEAQGHEVKRIIVCSKQNENLVSDTKQDVIFYNSQLERFSIWEKVRLAVICWEADCIYYRYDLPTLGLVKLAHQLPMFIEINSNDVMEYKLQGRFRSIYNNLTRQFLLSKAAGLVFVSRELSLSREFSSINVPRIILSNGINLKSYSTLQTSRSDQMRFIFIGSAKQTWQGFDKINELAKKIPDAFFDVVGTTSEEESIINSNNVKFHGYLDREDYIPLLEKATVAFGSLALHRKYMDEASPLKVREYLAFGLPIIIAYNDTDFPEKRDFILQLPNTENNLIPNIEKIASFARDWNGRRISHDQIPEIDNSYKESKRLDFFKSNLKNSKRIVLLSTGLDFGGAEKQVVALSKGLSKRGWDVHVLSMRKPLEFVDDLEKNGVKVHSLSMHPGRATPKDFASYLSLIRRLQTSVIHSHMIHANILGRFTRIISKRLIIISTAHSIDEGSGWRSLAYQWTDRAANLTTNVSEAATQEYIRKGLAPADRIQTVPNGVDIPSFQRNESVRRLLRSELSLDNAFIWLCVGRLVEAKDHANLIRAFSQVTQQNDAAHLLLAGDGPLRHELEFLCRVYGIEDRVHFLGARSDIPALMSAADGYVLSSAWEGLPMVLLEAASCGLPLVATDVGGNNEVIAASKENHLVRSKDANALAEAMLRVMQLPGTIRQSVGAENRAYVAEKFGLDAVLDQWEAIYNSFLSKRDQG